MSSPAAAARSGVTTIDLPPEPWSRRNATLLWGVGSVVGLLALWQLAASADWVNASFTSSPLGFLLSGIQLFAPGSRVYGDLAATGNELLWGLVLSILIGIPLGVLIGWFPTLDAMCDPVISTLYSVPYVAFLPVIILWFGIGDTARVVIVIWSAIFPLVVNAIAGVKNADANLVRVARVFCASRTRVLFTVAAPAALPYILAGLRLGVGRALVGAIVAEFFMGSKGLGYLIDVQTTNLDMDGGFAAIALIAIAAVLLVRGVGAIERRYSNWSGERR